MKLEEKYKIEQEYYQMYLEYIQKHIPSAKVINPSDYGDEIFILRSGSNSYHRSKILEPQTILRISPGGGNWSMDHGYDEKKTTYKMNIQNVKAQNYSAGSPLFGPNGEYKLKEEEYRKFNVVGNPLSKLHRTRAGFLNKIYSIYNKVIESSEEFVFETTEEDAIKIYSEVDDLVMHIGYTKLRYKDFIPHNDFDKLLDSL